jgi:hypothetical protein
MQRTVLALLATLLFAGCVTEKIDWAVRVGVYTHDQAILDLGPPDKSAKLSDGTVVAEWLTQSSRVIVAPEPYFLPPGEYFGPATPGYTGHDFFFLVRDVRVNLGGVIVRQLLQILFGLLSWSSVMPLSCPCFFNKSIASRRTCRMATRPSSASFLMSLTNSCRRSWLNSGNASRMTLPWIVGTGPMFAFWIAFSIGCSEFMSHGWRTNMRGSGVVMPASSRMRICEP